MDTEPAGSVVFVLHTHIPWVLGHGRWPHGEDWLYEAAAECYIPLLTMLDRLAADKYNARITVGITPVLAEQLVSSRFRTAFVTYLEERRALAERDREAFLVAGDRHAERLATNWARFFGDIQEQFAATYRGDLLSAFRAHQDAGHLEIVTSAATHGYLPLLGRDTCVTAQIRAGVASYLRHFGRAPRGIWLPECAYRPGGEWSRPAGPPRTWSRPGLEEIVARNGLRFFLVDTHLVAGGIPLGTYEDRLEERRLDAASPASGLSPNDVHAISSRSTRRPVAVLTRDPRSSVQVWSADYGYPGDGAYLEFHRKRGQGGLRYWRITDRRLPLDEKMPYEPEVAEARVRAQAEHFTNLVRETLAGHRKATGRPGVVVAPFDTELFGHWWFEGPRWLEAVLRDLDGEGLTSTASECLVRSPPRALIRIPEGSWGQGGHHWVWFNDGTRWIWDLVYRVEDDFREILKTARGRRRGDLDRVLRQLARELLLLEASDWPFLITTVAARDYAEARVRLHFEVFKDLLEIAHRTLEGRKAPGDDHRLAEVEARDALFPDVDLGWWSEGA